jgi:hypothetical protein
VPNNCVPFDAARSRQAPRRLPRAPQQAHDLNDLFGHLSASQCAFLSGVLAILSEHGEEALTRSCEMVLQRFGRGSTAS